MQLEMQISSAGFPISPALCPMGMAIAIELQLHYTHH